MRRFSLTLVLLVVPALTKVAAQTSLPRLEAVTVRGGWIAGSDLRTHINSAKGPGVNAEMRFDIGSGLYLQLGIGFAKMEVNENDPVTRWNWEYWTRTYRSYLVTWLGGLTDSVLYMGQMKALRNVTTDQFTGGERFESRSTPYAFRIQAKQYVNLLPVTISQGFGREVMSGVRFSGHWSLSFISFERNLYLDESWEKKRKPDAGPDSGGVFVFDYNFRNFAEPKRGIVVGGGGSAEVSVALTSAVEIIGIADYLRVLGPVHEGDNQTVLPYREQHTFTLGLRVRY